LQLICTWLPPSAVRCFLAELKWNLFPETFSFFPKISRVSLPSWTNCNRYFFLCLRRCSRPPLPPSFEQKFPGARPSPPPRFHRCAFPLLNCPPFQMTPNPPPPPIIPVEEQRSTRRLFIYWQSPSKSVTFGPLVPHHRHDIRFLGISPFSRPARFLSLTLNESRTLPDPRSFSKDGRLGVSATFPFFRSIAVEFLRASLRRFSLAGPAAHVFFPFSRQPAFCQYANLLSGLPLNSSGVCVDASTRQSIMSVPFFSQTEIMMCWLPSSY